MSTQKALRKFEKIYNNTYNNVRKYIICKCYNLNDVDDIIQETYMELYKKLKEKKEISNYQSYLITIAKNKIINYFDAKQKISTVSILQESDEKNFTIDLYFRYRYRI